jgi:ribose transport system substrate-binding protein
VADTAPFTKPIPTGKRIDYISCGSGACVAQAAQIKQMTDVLGWTVKVVNTDGTPGQIKSAFQTAVQDKPDAVMYAALDQSIFATEIPQLKANGTWIACAGCDSYNGLDYVISSPTATYPIPFEKQAAWVIKDSGGQADALIVNLTSYKATVAAVDHVKETFAKRCPACNVGVVDLSISQIATKAALITSYLQAHPKTNYVVFPIDDLAVGVPAALAAAGIKVPDQVKLVGAGANGTTLEYVRQGLISVDLASANYEWELVNSFAQHLTGDKVTQDPVVQRWLIIKDTAPASYPFTSIPDMLSQYTALWKAAK